MNTNLQDYSHKRFNILTGEWVLVSPHRAKRTLARTKGGNF